ncbi:MAG: hypothetical protein A2Z34_06970 [Planctomycetes bacterium RBG_16_59_8]|nr:MAG: hypothetical protein A2Z34_06970 [Planctomycetes bacterium RBG_16_59_8]
MKKAAQNYTIVIHEAEEGGYWAEVPSLPGCFSQGETIEETLTNTKDAVISHIDALRERGNAVPQNDRLVISSIDL